MSDKSYEYYGMMAKLWDFLRGDTSRWADRFLFLELVKEIGEPVLDVGCGTGRILVDFLQQGIDIDGVDNSPEMLALAHEKAAALGLHATLYEQRMEVLDLPRRYRTILVPSSSFQLLTDPATARTALTRFVEHLLPGGALVMPFMHFWHEGDALDSGWELAGERVREEDGVTLRRWSRSTYDPARQWEHSEDRYEVIADGQVVESEEHAWSPATRWYAQAEARALYAEAGLERIHMLREFTRAPAAAEDTLFTVIGFKPAD